MKFCPECGSDLNGSTKFCPECGFNILSIKNEQDNPHESIINDISEQTSSRELGNNLEDAVAKIFQKQGYEITLRQKISGKSGQLNEIDIIAKQNQVTLAIECKNYSEGKKIGVMAIRDFIAKMDDLDIHQGLFVTNTDFSSDALGWAKNGTTKPIEMWNGNTLQEKLMQVTLGRTKNKTITIENCLALRGSFEDYTILTLQNHEKVKIKSASLDFCPFYVVSFNLYDRVKTPDKHIRTVSNSGKYFVEGLTGLILASQDEHGTSTYTDSDEGKEMIQELLELDSTIVEIAETSEYNIKKHESPTSKKEAEFTVKNKISDDNKANISYEVKISRDEYEYRDYHYKPPIKAITTQSKILYVPIWNI